MLTLDRRRGALLGLAVGDALGAAIEFKPPGSFPPVTGFRAGGPHGLQPGEWTDDTSMALALADSIGQVGWDLNDQATRYLEWWKDGRYSVIDRCFDIGVTTSQALRKFRASGDARTSGNPAPNAAGNGSIMRLAPVAIRYAGRFPDSVEELARLAAESSLPTHASEPCLSACRYLVAVLVGLMHGEPRQAVLDPAWAPARRVHEAFPPHPAIAAIVVGSYRGKRAEEIEGSGYVVKSLEAALWAFHGAADFRQAVLRAVNLGDDADTTGAVCGQLAGAFWGESGIPQEWRGTLARQDLIEAVMPGLLRGD